MKKFEYKVANWTILAVEKKDKLLDTLLNEEGKEGWEMDNGWLPD